MTTPITPEEELEITAPDELETLKSRATQLGISFHPSIGVETLRKKVNDRLLGTQAEEEPAAEESQEESENDRRLRMKREAAKLIRINVTCMNPAKREIPGEIITTGNSVVGTFRKFVPFNTSEGYHVPHMIYKQLLERRCQIFVPKKLPNGVIVREGKQIREFAIEVLPPLTEKELAKLAQRQAMANGTAED